MAIKVFSGEFRRRLLSRDLVVRTLVIFAISVAVWQFDPGGVSTTTQNASSALFYRVVAPMYPGLQGPQYSVEPDDQPVKIAVIVINDESLRRIMVNPATGEVCVSRLQRSDPTGEPGVDLGIFCDDLVGEDTEKEFVQASWPASFAIHAAVLEKIAQSVTPKGFFFDIGFFDMRSEREVEILRRVLCRYAAPPPAHLLEMQDQAVDRDSICDEEKADDGEPKIPIFVSGLGKDAATGLSVIPEISAAVTSQVSTRYIGEAPLTYNRYLRYDCLARLPSAAQAMHDAGKKWKSGDRETCVEQKPSTTPTPQWSQDERNSFPVYWATWGSKDVSRGIYKCRTLPDWSISRALWELLPSLTRFVNRLIGGEDPTLGRGPDHELRQVCPPHLSIVAHDFLSDDSGLELLLDDWFVMYGADYTMAADLIQPPTHDPIPAVFLHAMALDNLEQWYKIDPAEVSAAHWMLLTLFVGALIESIRSRGQVVLNEIVVRNDVVSRLSFYGQVTSWFIACAAVFISLVALISLQAYFDGDPPINFLGSILIITISLTSDYFKDLIHAIMRWLLGPFPNAVLNTYRRFRPGRLK